MSPTSDALFQLNLFGYVLEIDLISVLGLIVINGLFTGRVLLQWIASERAKRSVVPVAFWWMSLGGAITGLSYAFYRHEIPFMIGYTVTLVPYVRNLAIHYRPHRPPRSMTVIIPVAIALAGVLVLGRYMQETALPKADAAKIEKMLKKGRVIELENGFRLSGNAEYSFEVQQYGESIPGSKSDEAFNILETHFITDPESLRCYPKPDEDKQQVLGALIAVLSPTKTIQTGWFWFAMIGTAIFYSRFFIQWVQSERKRRSVMPLSFWVCSFIGAIMLLIYSIMLRDIVFIFNYIFNVVPYTRNIMLILKERNKESEASTEAVEQNS